MHGQRMLSYAHDDLHPTNGYTNLFINIQIHRNETKPHLSVGVANFRGGKPQLDIIIFNLFIRCKNSVTLIGSENGPVLILMVFAICCEVRRRFWVLNVDLVVSPNFSNFVFC